VRRWRYGYCNVYRRNNLKIKLQFKVDSNLKKITGNIFSKDKTIKVKAGQKIQGKIDFRK